MRKKQSNQLIFIFSLFLGPGCASTAWIVEYRPGGGQVGYRNRGDDIEQKLKKQFVKLCPPFGNHIENFDRLNSRDYSGSYDLTTYETTTHSGTLNSSDYSKSYSYSGTSTTPVTKTKTYSGTTYWRVKDISCSYSENNQTPETSYCSHRTKLTTNQIFEVRENCENSNASACFSLARHIWCEGSREESKIYFEKACKLGDNESCDVVGIEPVNGDR